MNINTSNVMKNNNNSNDNNNNTRNKMNNENDLKQKQMQLKMYCQLQEQYERQLWKLPNNPRNIDQRKKKGNLEESLLALSRNIMKVKNEIKSIQNGY